MSRYCTKDVTRWKGSSHSTLAKTYDAYVAMIDSIICAYVDVPGNFAAWNVHMIAQMIMYTDRQANRMLESLYFHTALEE